MAGQQDKFGNQEMKKQQGVQQGQEFQAESPNIDQEKDVEFIADPALKQDLDES